MPDAAEPIMRPRRSLVRAWCTEQLWRLDLPRVLAEALRTSSTGMRSQSWSSVRALRSSRLDIVRWSRGGHGSSPEPWPLMVWLRPRPELAAG
jgi:hypothetical protein